MVDAVIADLQVFFTNSIAESAQRAGQADGRVIAALRRVLLKRSHVQAR